MKNLCPAVFCKLFVVFLTVFTATAGAQIGTVTDLGVISQPDSVFNRDGGFTTRVGGKILWTFGDTFFKTPSGVSYRSNTAALADRSDPLTVSEPLDPNGAPYQALDFTPEEKAYNDSTKNLSDRIALWIGGLVRNRDRSALAFYGKYHVTGPQNYQLLGVGTAHFPEGSTTGIRDAGLLFQPDEPAFTKAFLYEGIVYLYGGKNGGFLPHYVACAPLKRATQRSAYRFWNGSDWVKNIDEAVPVFYWVGSGLTVSYNRYWQQFIAVYSPPSSNDIFIRKADRLQGPWSQPEVLFTGMAPAPDNYNRQGKQHPELEKNGGQTIYVSYFRPLPNLQGEIRLVEVSLNPLLENTGAGAPGKTDSGLSKGKGSEGAEKLPEKLELAQNYPNPFNPEATIRFALPEAGHVTLEIYNMLGQKVRTLVSAHLEAGHHALQWNATDDAGQRVASGVYIYRLTAENPTAAAGPARMQTKKMTLMK